MDEKENHSEDAAISLKTGPNRIGQIFAIIRLLIFLGIIVANIIYLFPIQEFTPLIYTIIFIASIGALLFFGILVYFIFYPGGNPLSSAFDIEAIAAIVIGMIAIFITGLAAFFTAAAEPRFIAAGLGFMIIYTFYIYRIVRTGLKENLENEKIRQKYGKLLEIDREKSDFITVTSHQLRTPLSGIKWSLESLARNEALSDESRQSIRLTLENVDRLAKIVDDMIKTRTFEEKINAPLQKKPVNLTELLTVIIEDLNPFAQEKNVSVNFAQPENEVIVEGDETILKIALKQVIDNAIRYSPGGLVEITLRPTGSKVVIHVKDTGIGIAPEDYGRVFKKFYRGKNALLVSPDGSGVGLHTAKNIIEAHQGTVNFFSELKKGTTFIITLPLYQKRNA